MQANASTVAQSEKTGFKKEQGLPQSKGQGPAQIPIVDGCESDGIGSQCQALPAIIPLNSRPAGLSIFCIYEIDTHIECMAKEHPHAAATYRIVPQNDCTFGVEVSVPGSFPTMVTSFATEQTAEAWIADHKRRVAENVPYRLMRGKPRN